MSHLNCPPKSSILPEEKPKKKRFAVVCAWCPDKAEQEKKAPKDQQITHGICKVCSAKFQAETSESREAKDDLTKALAIYEELETKGIRSCVLGNISTGEYLHRSGEKTRIAKGLYPGRPVIFRIEPEHETAQHTGLRVISTVEAIKAELKRLPY